MSYPLRIVIGSGNLQRVYVQRPGELITEIDTGRAPFTRDAFGRLGLVPVEYPGLSAGSALAPTMHWVRTADSAEDLLDVARRLLHRDDPAARITMVTPVYVAEGRGPETAIAPVPGRVLVRFRDDRVPADFGSRNALREDRTLSTSLHPFQMFFVEGDDAAGLGRRDAGSRAPTATPSGEPASAFDAQARLSALPEVAAVELDWLIVRPLMLTPSDTFWSNQWGLARIGMPAAWDVQAGTAAVIIGLPDTGVDLTHSDLLLTDPATHFNAAEAETGPPPYHAEPDTSIFPSAHGTMVAGLAAAALDNAKGVAGVAGGCPILPARVLPPPMASRLAAGINWCVAHGARVVNISWFAPESPLIAAAIDNAWAAGVVLCAAAGNGGTVATADSIVFPATHPRCIAVGAIDQRDQRKTRASPDGEQWASACGPALAVCAPGVGLWSTDIQGRAGWNNNGGGPMTWMGVNYTSSGDASGDYFALMGGTSGATAQVTGLAALLAARQPALSNQEIRDVIERTCIKISPDVYAFADDPAHPNGTWHREVGYGLVNAPAALTDAATRAQSYVTGAERGRPSV